MTLAVSIVCTDVNLPSNWFRQKLQIKVLYLVNVYVFTCDQCLTLASDRLNCSIMPRLRCRDFLTQHKVKAVALNNVCIYTAQRGLSRSTWRSCRMCLLSLVRQINQRLRMCSHYFIAFFQQVAKPRLC